MAEKQLLDIAEKIWQETLKNNPSFAMMSGVHDYDDQLEDPSRETELEQIEKSEGFLRQIKAIDPSQLSDRRKVTYGILRGALESELLELSESPVEMAAGMLGISDTFILVHPQVNLPSAQEAEMIFGRLEKFDYFIRQMIERHKAGAARGRVNTARNIARTINQMENYLKLEVASDPLLKIGLPESMSEGDKNAWLNKAGEIVKNSVRPAVVDYIAYMRDELLPQGRGDDKCGIMWINGGEEFYRKALGRHVDNLNADYRDIHQYGLDEVQRLAGEFEEIGSRVFGEPMTFPQVIERMGSDPAMRYKDAAQMMEMAKDAIKRAWEPLDKWFGIKPEAPCNVVEVPPESAADAPPAFYLSPALDGSRPGMYFLNTYKAEEKSLFEADTLAFHEAVPGHHLDRTIAAELKDVPQIQREYATTAFVEGWGLYSEQLGNEMGLITDDVQHLGRLGNDGWRACRLVVDTGMHAMGWDRAKAVDYFLKNSPIEPVNAEVEIDRYITWPGQACAYKMGQRKIMELRALAKKTLGSKFDIRDFHDEVLKDGGMNLDTLEAKITRWIESSK